MVPTARQLLLHGETIHNFFFKALVLFAFYRVSVRLYELELTDLECRKALRLATIAVLPFYVLYGGLAFYFVLCIAESMHLEPASVQADIECDVKAHSEVSASLLMFVTMFMMASLSNILLFATSLFGDNDGEWYLLNDMHIVACLKSSRTGFLGDYRKQEVLVDVGVSSRHPWDVRRFHIGVDVQYFTSIFVPGSVSRTVLCPPRFRCVRNLEILAFRVVAVCKLVSW